jgi:hypothetical protein
VFEINGVNVGVLNDQQLVIEPFSAWLWDSVLGGYSGSVCNFTNTICPDLRTVGLNGMDVNQTGGMPTDGCYNIFMVANPTTGDVGFICSKQGSWGLVVSPVGYTSWRKLMYGVLVIGGKLAPVHVSHWPMPRVDLTSPYQLLAITSPSSSWVTIDLSKLVPENARFVWYRCVFTGTPCNAYLAPSPSTLIGKLVAYNQLGSYSSIGCRIDSAQKGYAQLFAGGRMDIYLDGWNQTEVS